MQAAATYVIVGSAWKLRQRLRAQRGPSLDTNVLPHSAIVRQRGHYATHERAVHERLSV